MCGNPRLGRAGWNRYPDSDAPVKYKPRLKRPLYCFAAVINDVEFVTSQACRDCATLATPQSLAWMLAQQLGGDFSGAERAEENQ